MGSVGSNDEKVLGGQLALAILLLWPAPAFAHKLYVFAEVQGTTIQGRAYFPGDVPARNSEVIARDATGRELDRTKTGDDGKFTFRVRQRVDYRLAAQTPDGHSGQYVVHASELPGSLATDPATGSGSQPVSQATDRAAGSAAPADKNNEPAAAGDPLADLRAQIGDIRTQIGELRRQIFESDERLRFRDILGGIGFILGLAGAAFYMKARRSKA